MKVKVEVTVDIDVELWDLNYGTGTDAKDVREDVKRYGASLVAEHFIAVGVSAQ